MYPQLDFHCNLDPLAAPEMLQAEALLYCDKNITYYIRFIG
jgi:hypothetical protein